MRTQMQCDREGTDAAEMELKINGTIVLCFVDFFFSCIEEYDSGSYEEAPYSDTTAHELTLNKIEIWDEEQGIIEVDIDRLDEKELQSIKWDVENYALDNLEAR